ncbi:MAG TPA: lipoprotein [Methylocella sp.]|nr:lipoprotein [Methylocella sp.]
MKWSQRMSPSLSKLSAAAAAFILLALPLSACGRRGPLELPPEASAAPPAASPAAGDYPSQGEDSGTGQSIAKPGEASPGGAKRAIDRPAAKSFFLDPLL